jgi:hypothetical protein
MIRVLVVEGEWTARLTPETVTPLLAFLRDGTESGLSFVHARIGTRAELNHRLREWGRPRWAAYPLLYMAFHGDPGIVYLDHRRTSPLSLEWIAERLAGRCRGRIIHFGACATLDVSKSRLDRFLQYTGAEAITGYRRAVDWDASILFEAMLLWTLSRRKVSRANVGRAVEELRKRAPGLARQLAFRAVIRTGR